MQQWCSDGIVVGNNDTHGLGRRHESHHIGPTSMRGTTPWREKSTVFRVWATTGDSHLGVSNQLQRTAVAFLTGHAWTPSGASDVSAAGGLGRSGGRTGRLSDQRDHAPLR
jgi:hypothetical protein